MLQDLYVAPRGSRTKSTNVWLTPDDEASFDDRLHEALPASAWMCSKPGPAGLHQVHLHTTLRDAMKCGGVQSFLPLPAGATLPPGVMAARGTDLPTGPPGQAIVQLLASRLVSSNGDEFYRQGRLAVKWFEPDVGPALHQILLDQTGLIWSALKTATRPARVSDGTGHVIAVGRIGPNARALAILKKVPLGDNGFHRYWLVDSHVPA